VFRGFDWQVSTPREDEEVFGRRVGRRLGTR